MNTSDDLACRLRCGMALLVVALIACAAVFLGTAQPAQAKAYSKELRIAYSNGVKYTTTTFKVDLDRDGKADAVKVKPVMKNTASGSHGIKVSVKGKAALDLRAKTGSARFSLYYVHMGKKLEFLAIAQPRGKKDAFTPGRLVLYRYAKGKLVEAADLSQKWGKLGTPSHSAVTSASKGGVTVTAYFEKSPLGARSFPLSYRYDGSSGAFSLSTASARPLVAPKSWKASVKRALYKDPMPASYEVAETKTVELVDGQGNPAGSTTETTTRTVRNEKVATMKKGAKVTGVQVHRDGYIKVRLSNGKSGWFKWTGYKKGKPFKEVGAGY